MKIKRVGVVGCGIMGSGITQLCAQAGYEVLVSEINDEVLKKGLASINAFLSKGIEKGKLTEREKESTLSRIKGTTNFKEFADCDLVIEAVTENIDLKKKIFTELDRICQGDTILATNTSSLCVVEIARATNRIEKVVGLHFFNPAPLMKLLEVVRTIAVDDEVIQTAKEFGESLGKVVVVAPDTPGFIVNRLASPLALNAIRMLEAGLATKEDIDTAVKFGLNYPMGPFELVDMTGLDSLYYANLAKYEELKDPQYFPPTLLKRMVATGWLGRKTGRGFYKYLKSD